MSEMSDLDEGCGLVAGVVLLIDNLEMNCNLSNIPYLLIQEAMGESQDLWDSVLLVLMERGIVRSDGSSVQLTDRGRMLVTELDLYRRKL